MPPMVAGLIRQQSCAQVRDVLLLHNSNTTFSAMLGNAVAILWTAFSQRHALSTVDQGKDFSRHMHVLLCTSGWYTTAWLLNISGSCSREGAAPCLVHHSSA